MCSLFTDVVPLSLLVSWHHCVAWCVISHLIYAYFNVAGHAQYIFHILVFINFTYCQFAHRLSVVPFRSAESVPRIVCWRGD